MTIGILVVGVNGWEKYTLKLINSIKQNEENEDYHFIVLDNGSDPPYPHYNIRTKQTVCYAAAINSGVDYMSIGHYDWFLILNNDVLCEGPFVDEIKGLSPDRIYGNKLHDRFGHTWVDGWMILIPASVHAVVGYFDERFAIAAYEDADYCIRAAKIGYPTQASDLPFRHLQTLDRMKMKYDGDDEFWRENLELLKGKHDLKEKKGKG